MTAELMTDEPLIRPASAGSALVRLVQVEGALMRHDALAGNLLDNLRAARENLCQVLQSGDRAATADALEAAQQQTAAVYAKLRSSDSRDAAMWADFGFPMPEGGLGTVDVSSVLVTYAKPKKQVTTSIAFEDAAGATGYWLHEITDLPGDEEVQDALVSSKTPLFPRVRLPIGRHRLLIESRNADEHALSPEFVIEVPDL